MQTKVRGKRALDCVAAVVALSGFAPVLAVAALAIRLEDGGPAIFRQRRVGRQGEEFEIWKLRTMRDQRVTRVGRWLRATGLDELPQFVQVLMGQMSVVGPRPLLRDDLERLGWADDALRLSTRPGIVGLAQVYGGGAAASLRLDHRYVHTASLRMDLMLIGIAFGMNIVGKARVRAFLVKAL